MKIIILFLTIIAAQLASGQIVSSSCTAVDSITTKYKDDADLLALRKIYRNQLNYIDSVKIPKPYSDTVLNALIAVYNATALPARDTVINKLKIHAFPDITMNAIDITADSNLAWMQKLKNNIIPTGDPSVDSFLSTYHLKTDGFYVHPFYLNTDLTSLITDSNYNLIPLTNLFDTITGVYICEPDYYSGDGNDIWDSVYADHVELTYSLGWGDCPAGCTQRRFWVFNVYFNCSVEYVRSYGQVIPEVGINETNLKSITVSPNPFNENIWVNGITNNYSYYITNILGQEVLKGYSSSNSIDNLINLNSGVYILTIKYDNKIATMKIIKQ